MSWCSNGIIRNRIADAGSSIPQPRELLIYFLTKHPELPSERSSFLVALFYAIGSTESFQQLRDAIRTFREPLESLCPRAADTVSDTFQALNRLELGTVATFILRRLQLLRLYYHYVQLKNGAADMNDIQTLNLSPDERPKKYSKGDTNAIRTMMKLIPDQPKSLHPSDAEKEFHKQAKALKNRIACAKKWHLLRESTPAPTSPPDPSISTSTPVSSPTAPTHPNGSQAESSASSEVSVSSLGTSAPSPTPPESMGDLTSPETISSNSDSAGIYRIKTASVPVLTHGGNTYTANSVSQYIIEGQAIGIKPSATQQAGFALKSAPPVLTVDGSNYTANSASEYLITGQTYGLAPGGSTSISMPALPVLTFGRGTYTANSASQFIVNGQTLGITLAPRPSTSHVPAPQVLTLSGKTYTAHAVKPAATK